jgi:hypothetical protein
VLRFGPKQPEKRGSKQNTGEHFGHDLRLAKAKRNRAYKSAKEKDDSELKKKLNREMDIIHRNDLSDLPSGLS